jgi:hypothetical protein
LHQPCVAATTISSSCSSNTAGIEAPTVQASDCEATNHTDLHRTKQSTQSAAAAAAAAAAPKEALKT